MTGRWWASNTSAAGSNGKCPQSNPCTWAQVLINWPQASINGTLLFKAGGGWTPWTGNVDALTIGVLGRGITTFDFEPACDETGDNGGVNCGEGQHGNIHN
jgi:hypothetical protein